VDCLCLKMVPEILAGSIDVEKFVGTEEGVADGGPEPLGRLGAIRPGGPECGKESYFIRFWWPTIGEQEGALEPALEVVRGFAQNAFREFAGALHDE